MTLERWQHDCIFIQRWKVNVNTDGSKMRKNTFSFSISKVDMPVTQEILISTLLDSGS